MLDRIDPAVFDEWYAMYLVEPWGDEWQQAGAVAAASMNGPIGAMGGEMKFAPKDFIPPYRTASEREALERRDAALQAYAENQDALRYGGI